MKAVKDLGKLGRNLKDIIIIDNVASSYALQIDNGIPISSYYGNLKDDSLIQLIPILIQLSKINDVRKAIK